ncbi:MAG: flavin-containing monooxygenase [Acidimicrobiia bacterium]
MAEGTMTAKRGSDAMVCIIGAGPSGITAAKNCLEAGLSDVVVYDKGDQVGGNWVYAPDTGHSSVYETTHIISSKRLSEYDDYPMPDSYPDYPSHRQLLAYFQGYADHFGVTPLIRFGTEVVKAEKQPGETWRVTLDDGTVEVFDHLIVANGHHWNPRFPTYPGTFGGRVIHSHEYKSAEPFRDQRVLVIGGGNSACDIAVETGRVSAFTAISMRRGYYIVPKFFLGLPADILNHRIARLPDPIRKPLLHLALRLGVGDYRSYGLERPRHGILSQHFTVNSELLYFIRHGRIHPRRDVARFDGHTVHFVDGTAEDYDVVVAATGFVITHPFFESSFIDYSEGDVPLYLRVFHPDHPMLHFVGLVQPLGCIWPLSDWQSRLVASAITGSYNPPEDMRQRIDAEVHARNRQFIRAARHTIEVEYHKYLWSLQGEVTAR